MSNWSSPRAAASWIATVGSRVRYRLNGGESVTDRLTAPAHWNGAGTGLPLTTARGLALVGLSEGYELPFIDRNGQEQAVTLETVCFQPEAARAGWIATAAVDGPRVQAWR